MRQKILAYLILLLVLISINEVRAQGSVCADIEPFCAGDERLTFPNSNPNNSDQTSGEIGPYYGCLIQTPYPSWFFLQVEDGGDLIFTISQYRNEDLTGAPLDVDFAVWGPFERGQELCGRDALNMQNLIDCSYLPEAVETMTIPNAQSNEVYVVVITNFQQEEGYISLQQVNTNGGSTDCSILDGNLGDNIIVCGEDEYVLDGTSEGVEIYQWYRFNESSGEYELIEGENGPTLTVTESGDYRLEVSDLVGESSDRDDVTVTFYENPLIGETQELYGCEENVENIDLTKNSPDLIQPNPNPSDYEVLYYESEEDIANGDPILFPQNYPFEEGTTIYARVRSLESGCFSEVQSFNLSEYVFPDIQLPESIVFCVDLDGNLLNEVSISRDLGSEFEYEWFIGSEVLSLSPTVLFQEFPGSSALELLITHIDTGCELLLSTIPTAVKRPSSVAIDISGSDFGDGYVIEATPVNDEANEDAAFEYQIDNSPWQSSNIFSEVPPGSHIVKVREINGCGITSSAEFFLVGYPRYFTPNSDGYNDSWNIVSDSNLTVRRLYIFDRYGKMLKQIDPNSGKGWDGTFNGKPLPANDYWFRIEFVDEKTGGLNIYSANFSLIR